MEMGVLGARGGRAACGQAILDQNRWKTFVFVFVFFVFVVFVLVFLGTQGEARGQGVLDQNRHFDFSAHAQSVPNGCQMDMSQS